MVIFSVHALHIKYFKNEFICLVLSNQQTKIIKYLVHCQTKKILELDNIS